MSTHVPILYKKCYLAEVERVVSYCTDEDVAVLDNEEDKLLVGTIPMTALSMKLLEYSCMMEDVAVVDETTEDDEEVSDGEQIFGDPLSDREDLMNSRDAGEAQSRFELQQSEVYRNKVKSSLQIVCAKTEKDATEDTPSMWISLDEPVHYLDHTPLVDLHLLFIMLSLRVAFVTKNQKLLGVIRRRDMARVLDAKRWPPKVEDRPTW